LLPLFFIGCLFLFFCACCSFSFGIVSFDSSIM